MWKLRRYGNRFVGARPTMETFGENVGILTHEIFWLEVTDKGFHRELNRIVDEGRTYEDIVAAFDGRLGGEARIIARSLSPTATSGPATARTRRTPSDAAHTQTRPRHRHRVRRLHFQGPTSRDAHPAAETRRHRLRPAAEYETAAAAHTPADLHRRRWSQYVADRLLHLTDGNKKGVGQDFYDQRMEGASDGR
ncbi:hypothetical protein [Streptomyces sp. NPDC101206]|uniref:hypothetical protein n=1 Tax=Streptomyces sp. NPDC101206 TaxID=3366128 RepID=UPI003805A3A0